MRLLERVGAEAVAVRRPPHLYHLDGMILPGGESSTIDRLLRLFELADPLRDLLLGGMPLLATCAGLITLARGIEDPAPGQRSLGVLDVDVRRNAFGSQTHSEVAMVTVDGWPVQAAFIRAPSITRVGPGVNVTAWHRGEIVAVRSGSVVAVAFHPELTGDATLHAALLARAAARR